MPTLQQKHSLKLLLQTFINWWLEEIALFYMVLVHNFLKTKSLSGFFLKNIYIAFILYLMGNPIVANPNS